MQFQVRSIHVPKRGSYRVLRVSFGYLILKILDSTTLELIESPKTGRKLPDTLSIDEIDTLIKAIDLTSNEGERNRAMLETLYGCGLRVSELVFENI
jgi:integrase/recombinase XerD